MDEYPRTCTKKLIRIKTKYISAVTFKSSTLSSYKYSLVDYAAELVVTLFLDKHKKKPFAKLQSANTDGKHHVLGFTQKFLLIKVNNQLHPKENKLISFVPSKEEFSRTPIVELGN